MVAPVGTKTNQLISAFVKMYEDLKSLEKFAEVSLWGDLKAA